MVSAIGHLSGIERGERAEFEMQNEEGLNFEESVQLERLEQEHSRAVSVANEVLALRGMNCLEFLEANETVRYLADRIAKLKGGHHSSERCHR